jgi:hypothetical protein
MEWIARVCLSYLKVVLLCVSFADLFRDRCSNFFSAIFYFVQIVKSELGTIHDVRDFSVRIEMRSKLFPFIASVSQDMIMISYDRNTAL